ncbi:MAG: hypothetical protein RR840_00625 [Clostridium sp.]
MRFSGIEKAIVKIDKDISALKIAKKYLSNKEEIDEVQFDLNKKRQDLVQELYSEDSLSYIQCVDMLDDMMGKSLNKEEQKEVLGTIKECFGRECAEASKSGNGLNAWLKKLNIDYEWEENNTEWPNLVMKDFGVFNNIYLD